MAKSDTSNSDTLVSELLVSDWGLRYNIVVAKLIRFFYDKSDSAEIFRCI